MADVNSPQTTDPDATGDQDQTKERALRILLAEDDLLNQQLVLLILERLGYGADVALDGLAVLQMLKERPYDVVLMDLYMPKVDGLEATRRIRQDFPAQQQPIIVAMTAHTTEVDHDWCQAVGLDDYLGKPVDVDQLAAVLNRISARPTAATAGPSANAPNARQPSEGVINQAAIKNLKDMLADDAPALLPVLIDRFYANAANLIAEIKQAQQRGRVEGVCRAAHTLKAASATFGADGLTALAASLEQQTQAHLPENITTLIEQIEAEYANARAALEAFRLAG